MAKLYLSNGSTFNLFKIDLVNIKANLFPPTPHTHDDRYYTEDEVNSLLNGKLGSNDNAVSASKLNGFENLNIANRDANTVLINAVTHYSSNGPAISLGAMANDGALYSQKWNDSWVSQIAQDYRNGRLFVRGKNNGVWQQWKRVAQYEEIPVTYDWAKVNNKPNTVSDYGITDAYTVAQVNANFAAKATTLSGYGITDAYTKTEVNTRLANKADLVGGKVPANLLPSFVDDVLEFASFDNFPYDGESGKIYIDKDTNKTYRWSGSKYAVISETLALGETPYTAYSGTKGKANALAISNINTALAGKLGDKDTAYDSERLNGLLPSKYVLLENLGKDYYTKQLIDATYAPISSVNKIINGTTPAGDSIMLNGISAVNYVLASTLYDYATKNYVTNSFVPILSFEKIVDGRTQVGNTKKIDGKEVKYYTQSAFASITPATGVHYIVYEN